MRRAPMHRFVARKPAASPFAIRKVGMLLPALMVAALVAPSARAIDLGGKSGVGAAVQAGPVNAGVSAATDARATTDAARDSGARAARETGSHVSGVARAARDTAGGTARRAGHDSVALTAAAQARADAVAARDRNVNGTQARTDARIGAQGSLQANDRAKAAVDTHAAASANSAIGADSAATATPPPEQGDR
jgi:hypothetical protein